MIAAMIILFVGGYLLIALEHYVGINKAATAIVLGVLLWTMYMFCGDAQIVETNRRAFEMFLAANPESASAALREQVSAFVGQWQAINHLGDISSILFYLLCAMTIVELIDAHGGFAIITRHIATRDKRRLLWMIAMISFFMSAVLDNLTTAIVMIMLLRKLVSSKKDRWLFAGIVVIAANSGGAWTPIGDITTIMLWINENVTSFYLLTHLFLPSFVSMLVPLLFVSARLKGEVSPPEELRAKSESGHPVRLPAPARLSILVLGVACLVSVPLFKAVTYLPPFMGILLALGLMWVYTEIVYNRNKAIPHAQQHRIPFVLTRIDMPTILFFLGILMAVAALECAGVLHTAAAFLDGRLHNPYLINSAIGVLSSIVDNVPLVAAAMGMYPLLSPEAAAAAADPAYMANFVQDGVFWQLLTFCAGTGGSILIIGSAAGVVVMGLERMNFFWYLKNISLLALAGYAAGILTFLLQRLVFF